MKTTTLGIAQTPADPVGSGLDALLDEKAAAELLDVTPGTLSVWRSTGRYSLPFVKVGRNVRYRRCDIEAWLRSRIQARGATA